jgi:hypothetical protein
MKTENTKETNASVVTKAKVKSLKLAKETIEKLSEQDATAVRGGGRSGGIST